MDLTADQIDAVQAGEPVAVTIQHTECVVVRKDVYERVQNLLYDTSDWTQEELRALLARSADANGWNEPGMEDYDQYDAKRP
jgi:hypothetical protein